MPAREPPNFLIDAKPLELANKRTATARDAEFADEVAENIQVALGLDVKTVASIRTKEAGDLLAWLHAQGHLKFSSLSAQILLDIQAGKHRR